MCTLMWWLARLAKRRMGVGSGTVSARGLRIVGKRPLDQKHALYVVEIAGGRHILLGASQDGGVSKLDDISPEEFSTMTEEAPSRGKLASLPTASEDALAADEAAAPAKPQFASVGQSFAHFLGKAKDSRAARRGDSSAAPEERASGE
jgi:hypothetical protein